MGTGMGIRMKMWLGTSWGHNWGQGWGRDGQGDGMDKGTGWGRDRVSLLHRAIPITAVSGGVRPRHARPEDALAALL